MDLDLDVQQIPAVLLTLEELIAYLLYEDDEEIRTGIIGDCIVSDEMTLELKQKVLRILRREEAEDGG